jgi:hypothetical protein
MFKVTRQERWLVKHCSAYFIRLKQKRKERFCKNGPKVPEGGLWPQEH